MRTTKIIAVFILLALVIGVTSAAPYRDYQMKYAPVPTYSSDGTGSLYVTVLCHHNLFSKDFTIQRIGGNTTIGNSETLHLRPDGTFDDRFNAGTYHVELLDGNGGHPELAAVEIRDRETSYVTFIGHAITSRADPIPTQKPTPVPTTTTPTPAIPEPTPTPPIHTLQITNAFYGADVIVPAWDETVETNHTEYQYWVEKILATPDTYKIVSVSEFTGHCKETNGAYDFKIENKKYRIGTGNGYNLKYQKTDGRPEVAAHWSEWQLTKPSGSYQSKIVFDSTKIVHRQETTTPKYVDVTTVLNGLIVNGTLALTADYPNQHYNALFTDPCYGTLKHLSVDYVYDGNPRSIVAQEDQNLNLP